MTEDDFTNSSSVLNVGDGHKIWWMDWGNPKAEPIFYLHGGPGSGCNDSDTDMFDPKLHRVIFHDQRGSGKSTPFASIKNNTTTDLIEDIEKLRKSLGIKKLALTGFSWGSTISLLYAIAHPENVTKMLIGGIFLARQIDNEFYLGGAIKSHFPEVWQEFLSKVPANRQADAAVYYQEQMVSKDKDRAKEFARSWMKYEASLVRLDFQPKKVERGLKEFAADSLGPLEAHYLLNHCFIEENYILKNADVLNNKKVVILHGRYDFVCLPEAAYQLHKAIPASVLHIAEGGHASSDLVIREVRTAYIRMLFG